MRRSSSRRLTSPTGSEAAAAVAADGGSPTSPLSPSSPATPSSLRSRGSTFSVRRASRRALTSSASDGKLLAGGASPTGASSPWSTRRAASDVAAAKLERSATATAGFGAVAGAVSHVPGSIGVLEYVFVEMLEGEATAAAVLAAVVVYRALYYVLPFLLALGVFGLLEYRLRGRRTQPLQRLGSGTQRVSRVITLHRRAEHGVQDLVDRLPRRHTHLLRRPSMLRQYLPRRNQPLYQMTADRKARDHAS